MKRIFSLVFFLIVLICGLFFGLLNAEPVRINYYFGARELPLSLILVITLLAGAVCGVLAAFGMIFRKSREIARLRKEIKVTGKELSNLRSLPYQDER
jgi:lipopolysaccharide assembly protein A